MSGGTWQDGWTRRAYVDIGPYRVRQLLAGDQIGSAIEEAGNNPEAVFRIGHYLFWRWALSVSSDGHTERHGVFSFIVHSIVITVVFAVVFSLLGMAWGLLGWIGFGLWAAHTYMNVSARFGSSVPEKRMVPEAESSGAS